MAEVQTTTQTGELAQRFVEFVMMQAQNAALFLGQIPNPKTGEGEVNLEVAKMFIDQLEMIQEKTRGNLSSEETAVLRNTVSNLQMAYVEVAEQVKRGGGQSSEAPAQPPKQPASPVSPASSSAEQPAADLPPISVADEGESKKKFTKSYGS
jgi:hypothetical protein